MVAEEWSSVLHTKKEVTMSTKPQCTTLSQGLWKEYVTRMWGVVKGKQANRKQGKHK